MLTFTGQSLQRPAGSTALLKLAGTAVDSTRNVGCVVLKYDGGRNQMTALVVVEGN